MELATTGGGGISIVWLVVDLLCNVADFLDGVLPTSALPNVDLSGLSTYICWVNWVGPVGSILDTFGVWCAALAGAAGAKSLADRVIGSLGNIGEVAGDVVMLAGGSQ